MKLLGQEKNEFEIWQTSHAKDTSSKANLILFELVIPDTMKVWLVVKIDQEEHVKDNTK